LGLGKNFSTGDTHSMVPSSVILEEILMQKNEKNKKKASSYLKLN
jgi:hypothetical protein